MLVLRVNPSMDLFVVAVGFLAVALGRGKAFVRDWAPFALIFLAWEGMRGIANAFGQAVQSDSVIALEQAIFGAIPTVDLESALYVPGQISALDIGLSLTYFSHFFFPLAFAFFLWVRHRGRYYHFALALMVMSYLAFVTFVIMPVRRPDSPPTTAQRSSCTTSLVRCRSPWSGPASPGRTATSSATRSQRSHPCTPRTRCWSCFRAERSRLAAAAWLPVVALIWFATVYLGHHYVVDLIGGLLTPSPSMHSSEARGISDCWPGSTGPATPDSS